MSTKSGKNRNKIQQQETDLSVAGSVALKSVASRHSNIRNRRPRRNNRRSTSGAAQPTIATIPTTTGAPQLVTTHGDRIPALNERVEFNIGSKSIVVVRGLEEEKPVYNISINDVWQQKSVEVDTKWGWSYTPRLAAAHLLKMDYAAGDFRSIALFSSSFCKTKKSENNKNLSLQWIRTPPINLSNADKIWESCKMKENQVTPSMVLRLLDLNTSTDSLKKKRKRIKGYLENARKFWVASGVHTMRNNPSDFSRRLTVRYVNAKNEKKTIHFVVQGVDGGAYDAKKRNGGAYDSMKNRTMELPIIRGNEFVRVQHTIKKIDDFNN